MFDHFKFESSNMSRKPMSFTFVKKLMFTLILTAIMVAKLVGDQLTHPIYHALLEVKCIPILDEEPIVYTSDKNGKSVL